MVAALWTGYVPPPKPCTAYCKPVKPTPDGSPVMGWVLVGFGVAALIAAVVLMIVEERSRPAADEVAEEEKKRQDQLWGKTIGGLIIAGVACASLGGLQAAYEISTIDSHKKQLDEAASAWLSLAVDGPRMCQEAAANPLVPVPGAQTSSSHCSPSPRDYTDVLGISAVYTEFPVETVVSQNFHSDGEATFHDTLNNRALCVRVPTTVPASDGDLAADITSGACPDAPVSSGSGY